jgi:hypothetical protein
MSTKRQGRAGNEIIRSQTVRLDYAHFEKKTFLSCTLVYGGGLPPTLIECDFIDSRFDLEGPAQQTAQLLGSLANGGGEGGKSLISEMLGIKLDG